MEDYTYHLGPGTPKILGAHMLEVCPTIAAGRPRVEIHPLGIGDREDPVRLVFDAAPGPAAILGICDLGDRFRLVLNEVDVVAAGRAAAQAARSPGRSGSRSPTWPPRPSRWITAGGPHHTVLSTAVGTEELIDFADMLGVELLIIDARHHRRDFADRIRWNQAYYRLGPGVLGGRA